MFTNKSKTMNARDYHSCMNNPALVRQQLIQFVCRQSPIFETREWDSNPLVSLGESIEFKKSEENQKALGDLSTRLKVDKC